MVLWLKASVERVQTDARSASQVQTRARRRRRWLFLFCIVSDFCKRPRSRPNDKSSPAPFVRLFTSPL